MDFMSRCRVLVSGYGWWVFDFSELGELGIGDLQGLPQKVLEEEIPDLEVLSQALNFLLQKVCCQ